MGAGANAGDSAAFKSVTHQASASAALKQGGPEQKLCDFLPQRGQCISDDSVVTPVIARDTIFVFDQCCKARGERVEYLHRVLPAGALLSQAPAAAAAGLLEQAPAAAAAPEAQAAAGAPPRAAALMLARLPPEEQPEIVAPAAVATAAGTRTAGMLQAVAGAVD